MNIERLLKVIEDMTESVSNLEECTTLLLAYPEAGTTKFIAFGLKQFKVGMDMRQGLEILRDREILDETLFH